MKHFVVVAALCGLVLPWGIVGAYALANGDTVLAGNGVSGTGSQRVNIIYAASKGDKNVEEHECIVVRKWKHGEARVVFVVRCPGSEDFGIADVDEKVYRKGGAMLLQLDNEEGK